MDCTFDVMRVVMREPAAPARQPVRRAHRAPVTLRELQDYAADIADTIERLSEDGLASARAVMELDRTLRAVRSEIARRRGV